MAIPLHYAPAPARRPPSHIEDQPRTGPVPGPSTATTTLALAALTAVAGVLRLWNSTGQSVRLDEGFSIRWASSPLHQVVQGKTVLVQSLFQYAAADVHPPGYLLFLHFWMRWFGADLAALRLPSELAGTLAVPALFLLASTLYGRTVGLVAALLGALSPFWIWHAQEARMYSFLLLFTVLSSYGLAEALLHRRAWGWGIYALASLAAIYTQYFAFFVLLAQTVFVVLYWRRFSRRQLAIWAGLNAAMAAAYLPWVYEMRLYYHGASDPSLVRPDLYTPLTLLSQFVFGYLTVPITSAVIAAWPLLVPVGLALGIFGSAASRRASFLWLLFLVPIVAAFGISFTVKPFLSTRYLIVVTPALYILLAVAFSRLPARPLRLAAAAAVAGLLLLSWRIEETHASNPALEDYRPVVRYVEAHSRPGDVVALDSYFNQDAYLYDAHNNLPTYAFPPFWRSQTGGAPLLSSRGLNHYLREIANGHKRLWGVYYLESNNDPRNAVRHYLAYNTAGHSVIFGGPYQRGQERYPGSYRSVQLILYRLIPRHASSRQVRPITVEQRRALTYLSPTTRHPYDPAFAPPGTLVSSAADPRAIPHPRKVWTMPAVSGVKGVHLNLFNPNTFLIRATVSIAGVNRTVRIPGHSNLDVRIRGWVPRFTRKTMMVRSVNVLVPSYTWVQGGQTWTRYGFPLPRLSGESPCPGSLLAPPPWRSSCPAS